MNRERARAVLILAVVRDMQDTCSMDDQYLRNLLEFGHSAVSGYTNNQLVQHCYDLGLQEQDDEVNEACETLERP